MNPILAVGSVAFDSIKTPFGEANRVVGGAATYFAIAASFFTEVRIVAVVGDDFGGNVEKVFGGRRIDLTGLERVPGETFRWKGEYGFDLNSRETIYTHLNVFEKFTPKIPAAHITSPFVFLGNIHPTLQIDVLNQVQKPTLVGGGHDELLDRTHARRAEAGAETGRRASDQRFGSPRAGGRSKPGQGSPQGAGDGPEDARDQARRAWRVDDALGRRLLRGTRDAARGGLRPDRGGRHICGRVSRATLPRAMRVDDASLARAIIYGSTLASFAVEDFSVDRLLRLTRDEVNARFNDFKKLTHFDVV